LLKFNDVCTNQPVSQQQVLVYSSSSASLGAPMQPRDGFDQSAIVQTPFPGAGNGFLHRFLTHYLPVPQGAGQDLGRLGILRCPR
jgi:hypothetical protein